MRLGVFSDLHGSARRWDSFLRMAAALDLEAYVCCGDLLGGRDMSAILVGMASLPCVHWVAGNNDLHILRALCREGRGPNAAARFFGGTAFSQPLPSAIRDNTDGLPAYLETEAEGERIAVMHGSPIDPLHGRLYSEDIPAFDYKGKAGVVITGHTHCRMAVRRKNTLFLNPGSLSQPRDGLPPCFAVLTLPGKSVEFIDM